MRLSDRAPQKRIVAIVCILAAIPIGILITGQPIPGILGSLMVFGATAEFLLPVTFSVSENGASRKCGLSVSSITWQDVKRVILDEGGIKLSPLENSTRMAPFRGVYLRFQNNQEELLNIIKRYWEHDVGFLEESAQGRGDRSPD